MFASLAIFFFLWTEKTRSGIMSRRLLLVTFEGFVELAKDSDCKLLWLRDLLKAYWRDFVWEASLDCTFFRTGRCFSSLLLLMT